MNNRVCSKLIPTAFSLLGKRKFATGTYATGLVPIGVPMNRLLRLPLTIFERSYACGRYIELLHFDVCDLLGDRQWRAHNLVCEQHTPSSPPT